MFREVLLTAGAILGVICIILTVASVAWGVKPLVFRSGSMSPTIETGALAFSKSVPAGNLKVGDIVSVMTTEGTRITHRITSLEASVQNSLLTLRGDANNVDDAELYTVQSADRVFYSVPKAGYVVAWLSGPFGTFAAALLVGAVLILGFWWRPENGANFVKKEESSDE